MLVRGSQRCHSRWPLHPAASGENLALNSEHAKGNSLECKFSIVQQTVPNHPGSLAGRIAMEPRLGNLFNLKDFETRKTDDLFLNWNSAVVREPPIAGQLIILAGKLVWGHRSWHPRAAHGLGLGWETGRSSELSRWGPTPFPSAQLPTFGWRQGGGTICTGLYMGLIVYIFLIPWHFFSSCIIFVF